MVEIRRKMVNSAIEQNPTDITINRTVKIRTGGGFTEKKSQAGPFTVRIFQNREFILKEISQLSGTKQKFSDFGLLANYQTDIQDGPNVKDEFEVEGLGYFVVEKVNPQIVHGEIVGYQADLERVE